MSPETIWPVAGSIGTWPETKSSEPARTACEYGPIASGADVVETACRTSGRLDDLARLQAARAYAQALDTAIDHGANALEIGFEPARGHVVRVADIPADNRAFSAEFAAFCH